MIQQTKEVETRPASGAAAGFMDPGRFFAALLGLVVVLVLLGLGFVYLRDSKGANIFNAVVAIIWGVGGVAALYYTVNALIESLPNKWRGRLLPFLFVGPGVAMLFWVLTIPTLRTLYQSFFNNDSTSFVGFNNYIATFTDRGMLESFRNNLLWLFVGTGFCVVFGLLIAVLADRSKFENIAKALIFMPMAISFVGASVIWKFMYAYAPSDQPQIGLQNAILTGFGLEPQSWLTLQPWNNLFLIVVQVWMATGFAMVLFSAAIKGVPTDLIEAARVDGATEIQSFFAITIPYIQGTIITVTTTTAIGTLKIFDVVWVMTGGQYGTSVVGTEFYRQFFANRNFGYGAAIAIVLFIAISPVLIYNLRQLRKQEGF
ncbi:MAG: transporter [Chloroflexi bacterium]|jgi:alpha-glucoside transport system permease protein|nr:transporter [Chloroflexota bacterium]